MNVDNKRIDRERNQSRDRERSRSRDRSKNQEKILYWAFHSKAKKLDDIFTKMGFPKDAPKMLSNFWPGQLCFQGYTYASVENAFQGHKYMYLKHPGDITLQHFTIDGPYGATASDAKKAGGKGFMKKHRVELDIPRWNERSLQLMTELIRSKVAQSLDIQSILMRCKKYNIILYHHSRTDMFWGCHINSDTGTVKKGDNMHQI